MKVCSIVGARPQFIKAAVLSPEIRKKAREVIIHTGQHYDDNLSPLFFRELEIPEPDYHLGVGSGLHGKQTGQMLARLEKVLQKENPDLVLVYGDTNSTLAGALAAAKLHCPIGHVEAGLRSFNRRMPEEINRVLTDHVSSLLFSPTPRSVAHLKREGITRGVHLTGDVMYDALLFYAEKGEVKSKLLKEAGVSPKNYLLLTVHRAENTDNAVNLEKILIALATLNLRVVFPVHPRTRAVLEKEKIEVGDNFTLLDPVGYREMIALQSAAAKVITDSGGIQKEAYILGVPCITVRNETEWVETVEEGWNILAGADPGKIVAAVRTFAPSGPRKKLFGDGRAAEKIAELIGRYGT
jgi:UDP-GlcNAc3NAcA epimerase